MTTETTMAPSFYWIEEQENGKVKVYVATKETDKYIANDFAKGKFGEQFIALCPTLYVTRFAINRTWAEDEIAPKLVRYSRSFAAPVPERAAEGRERVARWERDEAMRAEVKRQEEIEAQTRTRALARDGGPATARQIDYLYTLGVALTDADVRMLSKHGASAIIDAVKNGEGVGMFGLFFTDGSN